ncbi:rRNA maturation RNase YbeY [Leucobacter sp. OH2974_COT-288]|uniref:Endoribonuclease YbeY n=1 Tax=Canibacter oris TaxID=1365628 RepID=A0A840DQ46_9MICO|nr:rRNA maturation RNase YbeY [Canibacter oris]MBB4071669.1 putative rRNA maturation factor [Canibacter oris]RRD36411.1 rRNA maturation RNase YbeY [Leucobacter sp. OH2974_COT-288]
MTIAVAEVPENYRGELQAEALCALTAFVLRQLYVDPLSEVAITFVDEAEMEQLHLDWMQLPGATDVMSFPMDELRPGTAEHLAGPGMLGDVVVCLPVAAAQAEAAGHPLQAEVQLLVTHSLLHLLGYDHDNPLAEAEMFGLQRQLLADYAAEGM